MDPKTKVDVNWLRLGQSHRDAPVAQPLVEEMAGLTRCFHDLMRKNPQGFDSTVELEGFAAVRLSFRALCQTVGLVIVHPYTAKSQLPDAACLLVNGLEMPVDIAAVKAHVNFPPEVWQWLDGAAKPVVVAAFNANGRLRDPAATTVIHVLGNVYFNMFGTNAISKDG